MAYKLEVGETITSSPQPVTDEVGRASALQISTNNVIVGQPNWDKFRAPLNVIATPPANCPHLMIGDPNASQGNPSAKLTFAGWNILHAGFVWAPASEGGEPSDFKLTFGANNDPSNNPPYIIFGNDGRVVFKHLPGMPNTGTADLIIVAGGNITTETSSLRFKENVEPLTEDFHKILALQPKSFTDKKTGDQAIGYVAEELDELELKNLIGYDADGKPLTINYKRIPVYMLEVLKEQQKLIKELQAEVSELKASRK
jgi:hypothetical protein